LLPLPTSTIAPEIAACDASLIVPVRTAVFSCPAHAVANRSRHTLVHEGRFVMA
jgi:hypothetical protein